MPNVMGVLRAEIRRLARKETKEAVAGLQRQVTAMRRRLAGYKKRLAEAERLARRARAGGATAAGAAAATAQAGGKQIRFSPAWVKKHRARLGLSRRLYARLVGVSAQTIMLWETGKSRPRRAALAAWRAVRGKGRRELKAALKAAPGGARRTRRPARAAPTRRRRAKRK